MVLEALVTDLPSGCLVTDVYVGKIWVAAVVSNDRGISHMGVAAAPDQITPQAHYQIGHCRPNESADVVARRLPSADLSEATVALATLNALNQSIDQRLTKDDAANWLAAQCTGRTLAIFGRFPFIEAELRPVARQVWVFERQPQPGEFDSTAIPDLIPQADIVAITGSTVGNQSIETILPHVRSNSTVVMLGPSTPLSEKLFQFGIDAMFGVRVANAQQVIDSVIAGDRFQKMQGVERVALIKSAHAPEGGS